jgi:hypothetical protein
MYLTLSTKVLKYKELSGMYLREKQRVLKVNYNDDHIC